MIIFIVVLCVSLDVDECKVSESFCDVNADCNNTRGSYRCLCKPGFTGDGKTCSGTSALYVYLITCHTNLEKKKKKVSVCVSP